MGETYDFMKEYLEKQKEDREMREAEAQFRYAERKKEKYEHRSRIESAAMMVCDAINIALAKPDANYKPEELVALSAALNHTTTALHAAENYAESQPYGYGFSLGFCG